MISVAGDMLFKKASRKVWTNVTIRWGIEGDAYRKDVKTKFLKNALFTKEIVIHESDFFVILDVSLRVTTSNQPGRYY